VLTRENKGKLLASLVIGPFVDHKNHMAATRLPAPLGIIVYRKPVLSRRCGIQGVILRSPANVAVIEVEESSP
jgi:hypothetical protein